MHILDEQTAVPQSAELLQPSSLNEVLQLSTTALEVSDELVSVIDIPQQAASLSRCLLEYKQSLETVRCFVSSLGMVPVEEGDPVPSQSSQQRVGREGMKEGQSNEGLNEDKQLLVERKWFTTCFLQIRKSYSAIEESLARRNG